MTETTDSLIHAEGPSAAWHFVAPPSDHAIRQLEALATLADAASDFRRLPRERLEGSVADGVYFIVHPPLDMG